MFTIAALLVLAALAFVFRKQLKAIFTVDIPELEDEVEQAAKPADPAPVKAPAPATSGTGQTDPPAKA